MNISDLAPQSLFLKVVGWLVVVAIVVGSLWATANHFESVGYQKRVAEDTTQRNKDLEAAAIATHQLQTQLDEAQHELNIAKQRLATLSANNVVLSNRLRESIATYNGNLSNDSKQALVERVTTLSDVLGECTSRYAEVAAKADTYAADLKMMEDAWPK
jgi:chromosome segregation ATPase